MSDDRRQLPADAAGARAAGDRSGSPQQRLAALDREQRIALCREVIGHLSDLVEGEAPPEVCAQVADWLEECQPFRAYRDTLVETIRLARELGEQPPQELPLQTERVVECIERVRRRLHGEPG